MLFFFLVEGKVIIRHYTARLDHIDLVDDCHKTKNGMIFPDFNFT